MIRESAIRYVDYWLGLNCSRYAPYLEYITDRIDLSTTDPFWKELVILSEQILLEPHDTRF